MKLRALLAGLIAVIAMTGCSIDDGQPIKSTVISGPFVLVGTVDSTTESQIKVWNITSEQGPSEVQRWVSRGESLEVFATRDDATPVSDETRKLLSKFKAGQRVRITGEVVALPTDGIHGGSISKAVFTAIELA